MVGGAEQCGLWTSTGRGNANPFPARPKPRLGRRSHRILQTLKMQQSNLTNQKEASRQYAELAAGVQIFVRRADNL